MPLIWKKHFVGNTKNQMTTHVLLTFVIKSLKLILKQTQQIVQTDSALADYDSFNNSKTEQTLIFLKSIKSLIILKQMEKYLNCMREKCTKFHLCWSLGENKWYYEKKNSIFIF